MFTIDCDLYTNVLFNNTSFGILEIVGMLIRVNIVCVEKYFPAMRYPAKMLLCVAEPRK